MSDQATAAQFRYSGPITVTHLNTRKEGGEDDKVLSVDVKFEARMSSGEVFGRFAPELHHDLFTDIGAVRVYRRQAMGKLDTSRIVVAVLSAREKGLL